MQAKSLITVHYIGAVLICFDKVELDLKLVENFTTLQWNARSKTYNKRDFSNQSWLIDFDCRVHLSVTLENYAVADVSVGASVV